MGSNSVWNLFNLVIMRADDVRHNRFLMRLMSRNPDNLALGILGAVVGAMVLSWLGPSRRRC